MEYTVGQMVYSKSGHDKGLPFIITETEGEFIYLVDGKNRTLDKPKTKKNKHVQFTNSFDADIKTKIENGEYILDADFVKAIKRFSNQKQSTVN